MSIENAERRVRQLEAVPGAVWAVGEAIDAELSSFLTSWSRGSSSVFFVRPFIKLYLLGVLLATS